MRAVNVAGMTPAPAQKRWPAPSAAPVIIPLGRVLIVLAMLGVWHWASGRLVAPIWISDPVDVAARIRTWIGDGTLSRNLGATAAAWAGGFAIGGIAGILVGFVLGVAPVADRVLAPYLAALYGLPKLALLPLLVIAFGIGLQSKIALVAVVIFFITLQATRDGVRDIDPDLIANLRIMGARRHELLAKVLLPATLPWIYNGLRISVSITLVTTVGGEVLSSNRGLGYLIASSAARFDTAGVFAAAVVLIVISLAVNALLTRTEASSSAWRGR